MCPFTLIWVVLAAVLGLGGLGGAEGEGFNIAALLQGFLGGGQ